MKGLIVVGVLLAGITIYLASTNGEIQGKEIKRSGEVKKWMKYHGTNSAYIDWEKGKWVFLREGEICLLVPKGEK